MDTMMEKERVTSFVSGSRVTRMGTWGKVNQQLGGDGEDGPNRELYSSCSECCEMNVLFHLLTTQTTMPSQLTSKAFSDCCSYRVF